MVCFRRLAVQLKVQEEYTQASTALARELASSAGKAVSKHDLTHLKIVSSLELPHATALKDVLIWELSQ